MAKIHQLPQTLVSKIAAGEVIERPVYAVKELAENALDAGADEIKIIVEDAGLKRISVIDNGEGMSLEDLQECFKPHTTSKLISEEQLHHIHTLGFRGEALSSIAAISKLTVNSRQKDAAGGNSIVLVEGAIDKISPTGMPTGTQIHVENLFYPVPARKKFLKSLRTEFSHIIDVVTHFAFAYPSVQFTLTHNGKTIFDLPKTSDVVERISILLGKDVFSNLLPVSFEDEYVSINGFLAKPQITTKTPHKQFLFINNRKISDKGISLRIKSSYGTLLEKQAYPVCILHLTVPYERVDVNVHPRKEEVRFVDTQQVLDTVERAVVQSLAAYNIVFSANTWKESIFLGDAERSFDGKSTQSFAGKLLKEEKQPWVLLQNAKMQLNDVMQMHNLYLVSPTQNGIAFIDQHAAHERILYEQYLELFKQKKTLQDVYTFAKPKVLDVPLAESELLQEHLSLFEEMGFEIEHFKGSSYLLHAVPELFQDRDHKTLLSDVLENLRMDGKDAGFDAITRKMIAYLACRSAVMRGDSLTKAQAKDLLEQLEKTPHNATCPHGRPTRVLIDVELVNKMFKR
jgi:DNA mismatch repair protein MutL